MPDPAKPLAGERQKELQDFLHKTAVTFANGGQPVHPRVRAQDLSQDWLKKVEELAALRAERDATVK